MVNPFEFENPTAHFDGNAQTILNTLPDSRKSRQTRNTHQSPLSNKQLFTFIDETNARSNRKSKSKKSRQSSAKSFKSKSSKTPSMAK